MSKPLKPEQPVNQTFPTSIALTALTFLGIGLLKGKALNRPLVRSGFETLFVGGSAAAIAYIVGKLLRGVVGV